MKNTARQRLSINCVMYSMEYSTTQVIAASRNGVKIMSCIIEKNGETYF